MTKIRTAFAGYRGRMGAVILPGLEREPDLEVVARVEQGDDLVALCRAARAEVVVDFTTPAVAASNARKILDAGCHGVIGTTGLSEPDLADLDARARAASRALLVAPNFALGVLLMVRFAEEAARWFPRAEIVETHHDGKLDAPSGTALALQRAVREGDPARPYPITSERVGSVPGIHTLTIDGERESLSLTHAVRDRATFAVGAVSAAEWLVGRSGVFRFEHVLFGDAS